MEKWQGIDSIQREVSDGDGNGYDVIQFIILWSRFNLIPMLP